MRRVRLDIQSPVTSEPSEHRTSDYRLLKEIFGLPLLAYLCATDQDSIRRWLEPEADDTGLLGPGGQSVVTGWLLPLAQRISTVPAPRRAWEMRILGHPAGGGGEWLGSAIRRQAGGELLAGAAGADAVENALVEMAVDAFPVLLAPGVMAWDGPGLSLFDHRSHDVLLDALRNDPVLDQLYGPEEPGMGRRGYMADSFGHGRTTQDLGFPEELILASWDMARMTMEEPGVADLVEIVGLNLNRLREAVAGGSPLVPVKLVFTGFRSRDGSAIPTPWGVLRPIHEWERRFTPRDLQHSISGTNDDGHEVLVSYGGEMVLDMQIPYRLEVSGFPGPDPSDDDGFMAAVRRLSPTPSIEWVKDAVALALVMAVDRPVGSWVVSRLAWIWRADPMGRGHGIGGWNDTQRGPGFMPYELSTDDSHSVERWCVLIAQHWTGQLDVAVRRLLSASDNRSNAADRLVDSVIVWEALFGTRQGESGLRISAAMAWLLAEDSVDARGTLRGEVSKIYNERSGIVHGRAHDEANTHAIASRAVELARDVVKRLFDSRPDLLGIRANSDRSVRLLLGG